MVKCVAYGKYDSVYDIACGMKGNEDILLSPNRAIFSALCGILSLDDLNNKERLLGKIAFDYSNKQLTILNYQRGTKYFDFVDVFPESCGMIYTQDGIPFQEWNLKDREDYVRNYMINFCGFQNFDRFIAAKVRREYFPSTPEFVERHYMQKDINCGIARLIAEEMGVFNWQEEELN